MVKGDVENGGVLSFPPSGSSLQLHLNVLRF